MLRAARTLAGVGVPLVFGAVFYVLLRPTEAWLVEPLTRWSPIASVRPATVAFGASLPSIVLDVAPDLAWAVALGALLAATGSATPRRWYFIGLALAAGYELLQLAKIIPGTWDPADLVAQVLGFTAGFALGRPAVEAHPDRLAILGDTIA